MTGDIKLTLSYRHDIIRGVYPMPNILRSFGQKGGLVQTDRHGLWSSRVGLCLKTNRSKHIGVTQLLQMPSLLPRASWRVYVCQLLPSGPGSRLTSCRSWSFPNPPPSALMHICSRLISHSVLLCQAPVCIFPHSQFLLCFYLYGLRKKKVISYTWTILYKQHNIS